MTKFSDLEQLQGRPVVFYDGTCGFCQGSVQVALKYNSKQDLYFAALQSGVLEALVPRPEIPHPLPDSILFYENGRLYTESDAILRIARHLDFPVSILAVFRIIPVSFRNFVYRLVAKNRYRIAGRTETCMLPSPEQRARFVG
ncbi:thiol-disulfide oxidoreductase DCC family protein [Pontibacter anaerobius]|uniref:DCC1-like thiol-disulfide oxidoreductase family protein n=1 Tax=Pontibacter anaerobius TaxID=2993940 RepID=A0ABT3REI9_9BACT|nr:DCC1-like thiol-disulfide oxidoreductase family protein [Pontibacter anaerobius]MCX2740195.1 DCC1-like thiol-disulfide oxidoreductase family protein [Pontibacter anaerobius]